MSAEGSEADAARALLESRRLELRELNRTVKFALEDGGAVVVDPSQTPLAIVAEEREADCTIRLSLDQLERFVHGKLSPMLAYTLGQIKVEGSLGVAMKVASLLDD